MYSRIRYHTVISESIKSELLLKKRSFQTRADYETWYRRMKATWMTNVVHESTHRSDTSSGDGRFRTTSSGLVRLKKVDTRTAAPFLYSVSPISDRLLLFEPSEYALPEKEENKNETSSNDSILEAPNSSSIYSSMLECIYPLSRNNDDDGYSISKDDLELLRASVSDLGAWSSFRLAKFYSDVDALTADVAYRHLASSKRKNVDDDVAFVTASHYNSRKVHRTDISKNVILRCYLTNTGGSSLEVRTDAIQIYENNVKGTKEEILVNVCFTSMVAVNQKTLRPVKGVIPSLLSVDVVDDAVGERDVAQTHTQMQMQAMRADMAKEHNEIRKGRFASSMNLRGVSSSPPTQEEMSSIHSLQQQSTRGGEESLPHVKDFTFRNSVVVYPERKNVHGKLFGGFVMEQGHILAQYAANFFLLHSATSSLSSSSSRRAIPLGLDEAIFLQPVSVGDHVTFTARVVHSTRSTCRVVVTVEVIDPADRHAVPLRSNRLSFLFGGANFPSQIVPDTYSEILMHVNARRRSDVEGPLDKEVAQILNEQAI